MTDPREINIIKLSRQIAQDKKRLTKLDEIRATVAHDIERATFMLEKLKRKQITG